MARRLQRLSPAQFSGRSAPIGIRASLCCFRSGCASPPAAQRLLTTSLTITRITHGQKLGARQWLAESSAGTLRPARVRRRHAGHALSRMPVCPVAARPARPASSATIFEIAGLPERHIESKCVKDRFATAADKSDSKLIPQRMANGTVRYPWH